MNNYFRRYTKEEDDIILTHRVSDEELARRFGRKRYSITSRRYRLKLKENKQQNKQSIYAKEQRQLEPIQIQDWSYSKPKDIITSLEKELSECESSLSTNKTIFNDIRMKLIEMKDDMKTHTDLYQYLKDQKYSLYNLINKQTRKVNSLKKRIAYFKQF